MRFQCSWILGFAVLLAAAATTACTIDGAVDVPAGTRARHAGSVDGAVHIEPGARVGKATSVDGQILIGVHANADNVRSVDGDVTLEKYASAGEVETVDGNVSLRANATVSGTLKTVDGSVELAAGSTVTGALNAVNSHITLNGAHVGRGITLVYGSLDITGNAVVDGGIEVEKSPPRHYSDRCPPDYSVTCPHQEPRIVIGPGATVNGALTFEKPVKLYVSDQAHVTGPITGAEAVKFSGTTPSAS